MLDIPVLFCYNQLINISEENGYVTNYKYKKRNKRV